MLPRETIATAQIPDGKELTLVSHGRDFIIMLGRDELMGTPDGYAEAMLAMLSTPTPPRAWANHPKSVDFQYNLLAPHGQKMLQGAPVEAELKAYADEVNEVLKV